MISQDIRTVDKASHWTTAHWGHSKTRKARIMPNCSAHCPSPFSHRALSMNNHYTHGWTSSWLDAVWRTVVPCYTCCRKIKSHSITKVFLCTICTTLCSISLQRRKKPMFFVQSYPLQKLIILTGTMPKQDYCTANGIF